jgi:hypothetical protein
VKRSPCYFDRKWKYDGYDVTVTPPGGDLELRLAVGSAVVMVSSHDCQFDKDWNRFRSALIRDGATEDEAGRQASADVTLDRTFTASPLLRLEEVARDRGNLMAGTIVGYLPVPRLTMVWSPRLWST